MKLPKLPKLAKLPKLPKMSGLPGLSKLFKKKTVDELDDEFDDEFDDSAGKKTETGPGGGDDAHAAHGAADDDADFDDDDDFDEDDRHHTRRPMIIAAAGAVVLVAGIAGGAAWWYFSGNDSVDADAHAGKKTSEERKGPVVGMALPPKPGSASREGGLNKFSGGISKGVMTPSAPRTSALGTSGPADGEETNNPAAGQAEGPSLARTVGDIGGRFGGRANPLGGSLNAIGGSAQDKGAGIVIPSVTSVTLRTLPDIKGGKPLGPTPDARLIEKKEGLTGALPITAKDGTVSWKAYARPHGEDVQGNRVAIVIMGFGLSRAASMASIGKLPAEVSLALDPYARDLSDWLVRARLVGHEVLLTLPMESERFPVQDAGPYSLDTSLKPEDNLKRLELVLSQVTGYFGIATSMGSRFGTSEPLLTPVLKVLKDRGLMLLTTGPQSTLLGPKIARQIGLPLVVGDIALDDTPTSAAIDAKLLQLESLIKARSVAVAVAQPYPATIARLIAWIKTLKGKKITLVPVSALINQQNRE